jgi:glycosyltransferase involved in cell wall biosynthesis
MVAYAYYEVDRRIRNYAEALVENGAKVDAIALGRGDDKRAFQTIKGVNVFQIQNRKYNEKGLVQYFLRILSFFIKGSFLLLMRHCRHPYDVIHVHNVPDYLVFMSFFPKLFGAKVILDIHDILPEFFCQKFSKTMDSKVVRLLRLAEKFSVKFADHVIVANHLWQKKVAKRNRLSPSKTSAFLNYPDLAKFEFSRHRIGGNGHRIIYPGTISRHHGLDIAIKAMPYVKERIPDAELHIYGRSGSEEYYGYLTNLIDLLDLKDRVQILDPVSNEELNDIYKTAALGVVPKRGGIFASEAFSTKIFDFFASGLPVVLSKTAIDEYYFDDSLVKFFEPEDEKGLAEAVMLVMSDESLREKLIENGFRYASENSLDKKKQGYLDLVESLCQKS